MTELETITNETISRVKDAIIYDEPIRNILTNALTTAFALGRASSRTPAQIEAWEQNRRRIGGKPGRKDKTKRTRRTRAELEASKLEKTT